MNVPREPIDVLRELVELAKTPSPQLDVGRLQTWTRLIHEGEQLVALADHRPPTLTADLFESAHP